MKNLAAYTACGGAYPPYISINEVKGGIGVSIREPSPAPGAQGNIAHLVIERSLMIRLLEEALEKAKAG